MALLWRRQTQSLLAKHLLLQQQGRLLPVLMRHVPRSSRTVQAFSPLTASQQQLLLQHLPLLPCYLAHQAKVVSGARKRPHRQTWIYVSCMSLTQA